MCNSFLRFGSRNLFLENISRSKFILNIITTTLVVLCLLWSRHNGSVVSNYILHSISVCKLLKPKTKVTKYIKRLYLLLPNSYKLCNYYTAFEKYYVFHTN